MPAFSECLKSRLLWTADADLAGAVRRALYEAIVHQHTKAAERVSAIMTARESAHTQFTARTRELWAALSTTENTGQITSISEQAQADAQLAKHQAHVLNTLSERLLALCAKRDNKLAKLLEAYGAADSPIAADSGNFRFAQSTLAELVPAPTYPEDESVPEAVLFDGRSYALASAETGIVLYASPGEVVVGTASQLRLYDRPSARLLHVIEPQDGAAYAVVGACGNASSSASTDRTLERVSGVRYARGLVSMDEEHIVIAQPFFLIGVSTAQVRIWNHSTQKLLVLPTPAGRLVLLERDGLVRCGEHAAAATGLY